MDVFAAVMPLLTHLLVTAGLYAVAISLPFKDEKFQYAGFVKRSSAGLIDAWIVSLVWFIPIQIIFSLIDSGYFGFTFSVEDDEIIERLFGVTIIIGFCLYFAVMESSRYQATFGKKILGLRVVDSNGHRIGFLKAAGRNFAKLISLISMFFGFFMIGFTKRKQGLHDMMAECLVVSANAPFLTHADVAAVPTAPSTRFQARENATDFEKEALRRFKAGELSEAAFLEIIKRNR